MDKEVKAALLEVSHQIAKTDAQIAKTEDQLNRFNKKMERYIDNHSRYVEKFFVKGLSKASLKIGDLQFDDMYTSFERENRRGKIEIDIFLVNSHIAAILEVKTTLHPNDITLIKDKISRFRTICPDYNHLKLLIMVAGETVHEDSKQLALNEGFVVVESDHETLTFDMSSHRLFES